MSLYRTTRWLFGVSYLLLPVTAFVLGTCYYGEAPFGTLTYAYEDVKANEVLNESAPAPSQTVEIVDLDGTMPGGWQLSVLNGGQPGAAKSDPLPTSGDLATEARMAFRNTEIHEPATLTVRRDENSTGEPHNLRFGPAGATLLIGDFDGDGSAQLAAFADGEWYIDLNGNHVWDDADLWVKLGQAGDRPVVGDWDGDGKTDIGVFGAIESKPEAGRVMSYDPRMAQNEHPENHPGLPAADLAGSNLRVLQRTAAGKLRGDAIDQTFYLGDLGSVPVAGDFDGKGHATTGIFRDGHWMIDVNGDGRINEEDLVCTFGQPGDVPVTGDFNSDGVDEIGVFRNGLWIIDTDGDHAVSDGDLVFEFGQAGDAPLAGDFQGEGQALPAVVHHASK